MKDYQSMTPLELRKLFRSGKESFPTTGYVPGHIQANLVILNRRYGVDFLQFMKQNPQPCPILEVLDQGTPRTRVMAEDGDITTDIPLYRIYRNGELTEEVRDVSEYWTPDMIGFLIGCSVTFDDKLIEAGIPLKHYERHVPVSMYRTSIQCKPCGIFHGNYVVSMRPVKKDKVEKAKEITTPMVYAHGAPVHIGDPAEIGIRDIMKPDYGEPVDIAEDEVPMFWGCGVTPQFVALESKPDFMISHAPGYMFLSDLTAEDVDKLIAEGKWEY